MGYLPRSAARRSDVRNVVPTARSVIVTGTLYNCGQPYSTERNDPTRGEVARYAWSPDYHHVIGERLDALLSWMKTQHSESFDARAYVDTGPVQERVYAQYAGIGWIGKNTCVINPELGSWLLLGAIICSLPLEPDAPSFDRCGACTLCLEACPTGAFAAPHELDATKCVSYLTIEYRGSIPEDAARGHRQPYFRVRCLPGSLPVERVTGARRRSVVVVPADIERRCLDRSLAPHRRGACRIYRRHGDDARRRQRTSKKSRSGPWQFRR